MNVLPAANNRRFLVPPSRPVFAAVMGVIGLLYLPFLVSIIALMRFLWSPGHAQVMTATQELPESDYARFWFVGRMLLFRLDHELGGHLAASQWFTTTFQINILSPYPYVLRAWTYPPTIGPLALIFAILPLKLSFWVWLGASLALSAFLLRRAGLRWFAIIGGFCSPAGLLNLLGGQNGILAGGVLLAALLWMEPRPRLAGALAGLLCIKPQLAFCFPVILLHPARRGALFTCAATVCLLLGLSLVAGGLEAWRFYFHVGQPVAASLLTGAFSTISPVAGTTVFIMARSLHASVAAAGMLQTVAALGCATVLLIAWRKPAPHPLGRAALTVCLAPLMTPYGYMYDLVAFSVVMAALLQSSTGWQQMGFGVLWVLPGCAVLFAGLHQIVLLPLILIAGAWLCWLETQQGATPVTAPAVPAQTISQRPENG